MQIYGPSQLHGSQAINAPHAPRAGAPAASSPFSTAANPVDELQISDAGRLVEQARQLPDVRADRVDALRAQIAGGTYETPGKLSVALDRLLDEIA